jgi:hypothetical protein
MPGGKAKGPSRAGKKTAAGSTSKAGAKVKPGANGERAAGPSSRLVDERIRSLPDWRGETLAEVRRLIRAADPDVVEECKWVKPTNPLGVPVWTHDGIVCTGEVYKQLVKLTFAWGASLEDPKRLFNSGLDGNTRRAIDIREGERLDAAAFKALVRAAVAENLRRVREAAARQDTPADTARAARSRRA